MGPSPTTVLPRTLMGGGAANQLLVVGSHRIACTYKEEVGGTCDKVHHDLLSLPHSLSNQSIRRSNGRKLHTAPSTQAPQSHRLVPDPDLLLIHRAGGCLVDLLPRLRQVPLRRLLRCQVLRPRPPVRYANPNPKDLSHSITLDRLDAALTDQKNDQKL
jgi:hypothetical protein